MSQRREKRDVGFTIPYSIVPSVHHDERWCWKHDVSGRVSGKSYSTKEEAVEAAKAAFMQSRAEDHISRGGGPVTLVKRARSKRDYSGDGVHTILTFSDGTTRKIQRMNAAEAHGLGGWHYIDGPAHDVHTWIADSEDDAIAEILRKKNR